MDNLSPDVRIAMLCHEAEEARAAGDLPAAAFGYAAAVSLLPPVGAEQQAYELRHARAICLHGAGDYAAEAEELDMLDTLAAHLGDPARHIAVSLRRAHLLIAGGNTAAAQMLAAVALVEARMLGADELEADSLFALAEAAYSINDFGAAMLRSEQALAAYLRAANQRGVAATHRLIGLAELGASRPTAVDHLRTSLEICRAIGDHAGEALALSAIGLGTADRAEARAVYLQGLAIAERIGDRQSEAMLANNLGIVYLSLGLYKQARAFAGRAVRLARVIGARNLLAPCLETLGRAFHGGEQPAQARVALREAHALALSTGNRSTAATALIGLALAELVERCNHEAAQALDTAIELCASIGASADEASALAWRGAAHLRLGEVAAARAVTARAVDLRERSAAGDFPPQEVWWLRYRALIADSADHPGERAALDREALAALERAGAIMYQAIATLSDNGLRRSYLGRVRVNRAIVQALARHAAEPSAHMGGVSPPASHGSLQAQLTRMLGVTARLNDLHDAAALRELFLDEVVELSGAERLMLLVGPSVEAPEALIGRGLPPDTLPAMHYAALPLLREALFRRRAMVQEDPGGSDDDEAPALRPRSVLAVPLISGARTVGVLYADVRSFFGPFNRTDLDLLGLLAAQAATALENARLYAQTLRAKEDLERQVAERTTDLRAANCSLEARAAEAQAARAAAEAASAAKSAFLANVSHELRTPLNAVLGFAQVLERDPHLNARQRELVGIIARSGDHLLGLINDVLELSKIEAGRLSISPASFDLHGTLADLDGLFRLRADVRRLEFVVRSSAALPQYVIGDEGRLRQILINLISNALKFTHTGTITIEADASESAGHIYLQLTVTDTGEGIAPDELDQLFQPFIQTASGRRAREGSGLGLSLSRQIARLMGGDITVASTLGAGSAFTVTVLVDPASGPLETPQSRHALGLVTAGRRYRVLVADSQAQSRRILAEWLQAAGVEVREVAHGAQALATWEDWHPHVMLIDPQLPVIAGDEVAQRIKESPGGRSTIVVVLTSANEATDTMVCQAMGGDDFLPRPVRHDELLACVSRHLGVEVRYDPASPPGAARPLRREDLAELPAEVRAQLAQAAAVSDPALVEEAVEHVRAGWPGLGARLAALAAEFQFELIEQLAQGQE